MQQWNKELRRKTADTSRSERALNKVARHTLKLEVVN
jgi:hypothetical protein